MILSDIIKLLDGSASGNTAIEISDVAKIEEASSMNISFISNPLYEKFYNVTKAGALLVREDFSPASLRDDIILVKVKDPYLAFLKLIDLFHKSEIPFSGISDLSVISESALVSDDVSVAEFSKIGKNSSVGSNTIIFENVSVGKNVKIGKNCVLYPNVTVYDGCIIGNNVIIHSGAVIGSDGFGFAKNDDGSYNKIPQKGIVLIEDDVEIGANTTIDRATIGETKISKGVKIDNQVMIAHNVEIGENTVIAAQSGIAGSSKIGKRCILAGKVGVGGHIHICDDVTIGAMVGIVKDITKPGFYMGYRGKPMRDALKEEANVKRIPDLESRLKNIENKLNK